MDTKNIEHNLKASKRSALFTQSEIRYMTMSCVEANGINMAQGVCDLHLPGPVARGAVNAIEDGFNSYTRYDGYKLLRETVTEKALKYNNISCDPEKNVVVSIGATGVFYAVCMALLDPEDEVIIFEPFYGYHVNIIRAVGAKPVFYQLTPPWGIDVNALEALITPRTKAILVNTPSNPAGKVFSREELKAIGDMAVKHNIFIFTDEIYEYFIYDGLKHVSIGSMPEYFDRTITISGHSKTFSITGWRVGYCICHNRWKEAIGHMNDLIYVCAPSPCQLGIAQGIRELPDEYYIDLKTRFQRVRDRLCDVLDSVGLTPRVPKGAYYVLADVSSVPGENSRDKALYVLKHTGVAAVPGRAFYKHGGGDGFLRFCFAKKDEDIEKALKNLSSFKIK